MQGFRGFQCPPTFLLLALAMSASTGWATTTRFALIGDFGNGSAAQTDVANRLKSYSPEFVVTLGDNNYIGGSVADMDRAVGRDYHPFIKYPVGSPSQYASQGASRVNFYPLIGNHDWDEGLESHSSYYTFPRANTRYYDFVRGAVHFFLVDSDIREPDGTSATSVQANWLRGAMAASTAPWKLVLVHHPPYSSSGSHAGMRWPYAEWGADAILTGHAHNYEHLIVDGVHYVVNGLGGAPIHGEPSNLRDESRFFYDDDYGFMLATADDFSLALQFMTRSGEVIDNLMWQDDVAVPVTPEPAAGLLLLVLLTLLAPRPRPVRVTLRTSRSLGGTPRTSPPFPAIL